MKKIIFILLLFSLLGCKRKYVEVKIIKTFSTEDRFKDIERVGWLEARFTHMIVEETKSKQRYTLVIPPLGKEGEVIMITDGWEFFFRKGMNNEQNNNGG